MWPAISNPGEQRAGRRRERQRRSPGARASRYNVLTQAIDDTLYDAFGQRQVSTIFTQLNQYRVVLEAEPRFQLTPASVGQTLCQIFQQASGFPLKRLRKRQNNDLPLRSSITSIEGPISRGDALLIQPAGPAVRSGKAVTMIQGGGPRKSGCLKLS